MSDTCTITLTKNQARSLKAAAYNGIEDMTNALSDADNTEFTDDERTTLARILLHALAANLKIEHALDPSLDTAPVPATLIEQSGTDNTDIEAALAAFINQENNQ